MLLLIDDRDPDPERLRPDWALAAKLGVALAIAISLAFVPGFVAVPLCVAGVLLTLEVGRHVRERI